MFDDSILQKDVESYNLSIFTRAYNEDIPDEKLCRKNLFSVYPLMGSESLRETVSIKLPQVMIFDDLGFDEEMISLHFSKLRNDEYYINDIVMQKKPNLLLRNGIAKQVISNLMNLAKTNNIRYISGYAMNEVIFNVFLGYGFKADVRDEYGNDYLLYLAKQTGCQYPFYIDLCE